MDLHPQAPTPTPGHPLQWTPAEDLEGGIEARVLLWRGREIGAAFHFTRHGLPRTVLHGPAAEALGEPEGWLDGLESWRVLDRLERALLDVPRDDVEEAWEAFGGLSGQGAAGA